MSSTLGQPNERNQEATLYITNLDSQVTEDLLWELMLQVGPVVSCHIPKDRITSTHSGYGFVEFRTEEDADYALHIMQQIKLFGKPLRMNKATQTSKSFEIGANIFIGNLEKDVDENKIKEIFSVFGNIVGQPKIQRDENGESRGFAFVSFDNFESSDYAIDSMNGQFVGGKQITVTYQLKKDSKEKHGSQAERLLAANNPNLYEPMTQKKFKQMIMSTPIDYNQQ